MIRLLVVDDSALMRRLMGQVFGGDGAFELAFARDGEEALVQLHAFRPDVVTLDVQMPRMDGLRCLDRIMLERPCPVVMVSSLTEAGAEVTLQALAAGAVDFVPKPGGAISLSMETLAPVLLDKVRGAARTRVSRARRLTERVRLRTRKPPSATVQRHAPAGPSTVPLPPARGPADGVVLVGCSTGGPPALDVLLGALPADFPWPVLVAQHMPASFTAALARRLNRLCALEVLEAREPLPLRPGLVCIARGDADLIVSRRDGVEMAMAAPPGAGPWHPSVDRLVRSAMIELGPSRLTGILMTGMGNDGADALCLLAASGGRTIAESEESAVVWGMPGELVRAGGAQIVAPLDEIPAQLMALLP